MHILHIEEGFIPNLGYQTNLLAKFMSLEGHKITILTTELNKIVDVQKVYIPDDLKSQERELKSEYNIDIIRVPVIGIFSNRCLWDFSVFTKIKEISPDFIFLHSNDTLISIQYILFHLKKFNIPIITDSHMLEVASNNRFRKLFRIIYRKLVTPKLIRNDIPVLRVVDDDFINKAYNLPISKKHLMSFGSDIDLFKPDVTLRTEMREKHKILKDEMVVIYAGKLSEDKKGLFLAESIKEKLDTDRKIVFIVIGNTQDSYGINVEREFKNSENKIVRLPLQKYSDLPKFFQMSDLAIIPFGTSLTFYDMQACGLPVLWSDGEINVKRVSEFDNGFTFKQGSVKDFREKICKISELPSDKYSLLRRNSRRYVLENYSYKEVTNQYLKVIQSEVERRKSKKYI